MPIYEYICEDCSAQFEKFVRSMKGTDEVKCPECGSTHTKKGWSVFGTGKSGGAASSFASVPASSCNTGST